MMALRGLHRASSNTEPNTVNAVLCENGSDLESEDFAPGSKSENNSMNQPPVPNVLHDQARKWTPNEAAFSEGEYSSSSSSPGPPFSLASPATLPVPLWQVGPMPPLINPQSQPCLPPLPESVFIQLIVNLNAMPLTELAYWFETQRFIETLKKHGMQPFVESIFHTTVLKWENTNKDIKEEYKNSVIHGAGIDRIVKELVDAIRKHPEKFSNMRKLQIGYDLLRIGYSLKKPDIANIINECDYDNLQIVPLEEVMLFCKTNFSHFLVRAIRRELKQTMISSAAAWLGSSTYPFTWPEYDLILLTKTLGDYICSDEFSHIGLESTIPEIFLSINISPNGRHPDGRLLTIHWLDAFHRVFGKREADNELFRAIVTRCATVLMTANFDNLTAKDWSCIIRACKRYSDVSVVRELLYKIAAHIPTRFPAVRDILHNFVTLDRAKVYSTPLRNYVAISLTRLVQKNHFSICECKTRLGHNKVCYGLKTNELLDAVDIIMNSGGYVHKKVLDICGELHRGESQASSVPSF